AKRGDDLVMMMQEAIIAARQSVAGTPDLLPILKQAGVVDAGGQGFCTILEGIWRYIRGEASPQAPLMGAGVAGPGNTQNVVAPLVGAMGEGAMGEGAMGGTDTREGTGTTG